MIHWNDAENLLKIMDRAEYKGLDEAAVCVVLRMKLQEIIKEGKPDGDDVSTGDQPSPAEAG